MLKDSDSAAVFDSLVQITVGNGKKVLFWKDRWINGRAAKDFAPLVVQSVNTRRKNSRTVEAGMLNNRWCLDIPTDLCHLGMLQCVRLWVAISTVARNTAEEDNFVWPSKTADRHLLSKINLQASDARENQFWAGDLDMEKWRTT